MIFMINSAKYNWIKKHPALTAASGIVLLTIVMKIAHIVPLSGLEDKFVKDLRRNNYEL